MTKTLQYLGAAHMTGRTRLSVVGIPDKREDSSVGLGLTDRHTCYPPQKGVFVDHVNVDCLAHDKIEAGDQILLINGQMAASAQEASSIIYRSAKLSLVVQRTRRAWYDYPVVLTACVLLLTGGGSVANGWWQHREILSLRQHVAATEHTSHSLQQYVARYNGVTQERKRLIERADALTKAWKETNASLALTNASLALAHSERNRHFERAAVLMKAWKKTNTSLASAQSDASKLQMHWSNKQNKLQNKQEGLAKLLNDTDRMYREQLEDLQLTLAHVRHDAEVARAVASRKRGVIRSQLAELLASELEPFEGSDNPRPPVTPDAQDPALVTRIVSSVPAKDKFRQAQILNNHTLHTLHVEAWPCKFGYTHLPMPAEALKENGFSYLGFSQYIMEEVMHSGLQSRADELGLAKAPVVLALSPFVHRTACCPLKRNGLCIREPVRMNSWAKLRSKHCQGSHCLTMVVVVGWAYDSRSLLSGMHALMEMPGYFQRKVLIFSLDDELPGFGPDKTATLYHVLTSRNNDVPAIVAAPYPTLALEHQMLTESERNILVLSDFYARPFRKPNSTCHSCPDFVGSAPSARLRNTLAHAFLDTRGIQFLNERTGGVFLPKVSQGISEVLTSRSSEFLTLNLADHAEFCIEPPGDTPTRSHFYLAIMSGCIPVIFDGVNETVRDIQLSHNGPRWAWRTSRGVDSMFQPSVTPAPAIDYRQFTVVFSAREVLADPHLVIRRLRALTRADRRQLRSALLRVRHYFGYRNSIQPESAGEDAISVAAAIIRQFVAVRA